MLGPSLRMQKKTRLPPWGPIIVDIMIIKRKKNNLHFFHKVTHFFQTLFENCYSPAFKLNFYV